MSLSAAKQILEVHGAKVGGEGSAGKGSTFYFKIDLAVPTKSEEQSGFLTTEILNVDEDMEEGPNSKRTSLQTSPGTSAVNLATDAFRRKSSVTMQPKNMVLESVEHLVAVEQLQSRSVETVINEDKQSNNEAKQSDPEGLSSHNPDSLRQPTTKEELKQGKPSALLVDDVRSNRRMYGRILELLGFDVTTADDGVECLSVVKAAASPFTVILIDHSMVNRFVSETCRLSTIS